MECIHLTHLQTGRKKQTQTVQISIKIHYVHTLEYSSFNSKTQYAQFDLWHALTIQAITHLGVLGCSG